MIYQSPASQREVGFCAFNATQKGSIMTSCGKIRKLLKDKLASYANTEAAKDWLKENSDLVRRLFEDVKFRDFVFEPFRNVFKDTDKDGERKIMSTITQVAVANAVLAGLPGMMGIGVFVSIGLEAWMAYTIAKTVGIKIETMNDVWKYFSILAAVAGTIFILFKTLLSLVFSFFSFIPFINPMIIPELIVTDAVGVLFWFGFEEAKATGSFNIPRRILKRFGGCLRNLLRYQKDLLKNTFTKENIKLVGSRLWAWFNGDIVTKNPEKRGEIFSFAAMAYLMQGKYDSLQGPTGEIFIDSIRRSYPSKLGDASLDEMSEFFSNRTPAQLSGDVNLVKGDMFEKLVEIHENADSDDWVAELHEDRTHPGSDIIFRNINSGEEIEVSLKATENVGYIEDALMEYPDIPIITTEELEDLFGDHPFVDYVDISGEKLQEVTEENFEKLVSELEPINVAAAGVSAMALAALWPFVIAYIRKRISQEKLKQALVEVLGDSGVRLAARLSYAVILGPIFAWYLLARSVLMIVKGAGSIPPPSSRRVLIQK